MIIRRHTGIRREPIFDAVGLLSNILRLLHVPSLHASIFIRVIRTDKIYILYCYNNVNCRIVRCVKRSYYYINIIRLFTVLRIIIIIFIIVVIACGYLYFHYKVVASRRSFGAISERQYWDVGGSQVHMTLTQIRFNVCCIRVCTNFCDAQHICGVFVTNLNIIVNSLSNFK